MVIFNFLFIKQTVYDQTNYFFIYIIFSLNSTHSSKIVAKFKKLMSISPLVRSILGDIG